MQINITEIMKSILLDGKFVDGYGFEPRHPIIYNAFMQSHLDFEEFLKSCLLDKAPEVKAVKQSMQYLNIELSQHKATDYLSEESSKEFKEAVKAYSYARQNLNALCQNTLTTELSNNIMFQELKYIHNGKKLEWDQNTLSFRGKLSANKIMELSDVNKNN